MPADGDTRRGESDPVTVFALQLVDHVTRVAARHAPQSEAFAFGPLAMRLSVVGDTFRRRLTAAIDFARRETANDADWRIVAVDGTAAGIGEPPGWKFPVTSERHLERLHESADGSVIARFDPATSTWRVLHRPERLVAVWTRDAASLPEWDDAAPFRDIFHWITLPEPMFLAHAAAIGQAGRGVLLTGAGGSGKSTTTAAAVLNGLRTAGDDFVLIDPRGSRAHALYDAIKLGAESAAMLPELARDAIAPKPGQGDKGRIHLALCRPGAMAASLPIDAVLLPRLSGEAKTAITPATTADAVRALVPSTVVLIRGGEAGTGRKAMAFLRGLPAFTCRLGNNPREAADTIAAFIDRLSQ